MKIKRDSIIYDISNLAYIIANSSPDISRRTPYEKITDICEEGNRDRVARILGLAYAEILDLLSPVIETPKVCACHDRSREIHDYEFPLRAASVNKGLTLQKQLKIRELAREYMISRVLADWLSVHLPDAAKSWEKRAAETIAALALTACCGASGTLRRAISPF